ncbi:MAG: hypothetical protein CGU28_16955 [Candidatus Dactylopiibacterium carminicum]|nr:MAG: hypothetical protein CGU28_16955 [Candidatus Dactylopiibacterium carminicum]
MPWRLIISVVFCCTCLLTSAARADTGWEMFYPGDDSGQLEQIIQQPATHWGPLPDGESVNLGTYTGSLWLRRTVRTLKPSAYVLELRNPQHDHVTLHVLRAGQPTQVLRGGFREPHPSSQPAAYHDQLFRFVLDQAGQEVTLYLQVESTRPLFVWPRLGTNTEHGANSANERFWLGLYCGTFAVACLLSLLLWLATRDRDYLDNMLLIALMGAVQAQMLGIWHEWFLHGYPVLMDLAAILLPTLALYAFCRFARRFLDLASTSPRLDRYLRLVSLPILALLPVYLIGGNRVALPLAGLFGVMFSGLAIHAGIVVLLRGFRPALYYLIAQTPLVLGGSIYVASNFRLLPASPWSMYAFQIGAGVSVLTYALAIAAKTRQQRHAQLQTQHDLLVTEQRLVDVLRESEAHLEQRVQERTEALEAAMQQLQTQKEALEHSHRELNRLHEEHRAFLRIAAHDLKNPTSAIISYTDLLRERWHAWSDEKKLTRLGNIRSLSQLIFEIISNLLELEAIESGHRSLRPTLLNPAETLRTLAEEYRVRNLHKGIHIQLGVPATPLQLRIDRTALYQIIDNLVSNAAKYSPQGSTVHLSLEPEAGHALIQVRDEGPGISEEEQPRLFQKFARLSARPTGGEHSTGLGLSIVKHLVEASGGHIGCLSRPGEGATFFVTLPLAA